MEEKTWIQTWACNDVFYMQNEGEMFYGWFGFITNCHIYFRFPSDKVFLRHCGISNDLLYLKLYREMLIEFVGVHILDI